MDTFNEFFQMQDILKAFLALASGVILGYEREAKDKSAGLKTISLISVGSALFTILSQNFSGGGDNFAIAAGIISGIGFLGAGVIYKENFSIYGLTTAGIIWVSSAIGMAIGFGEMYIAAVFLISVLMIIYGLQYFGKFFVPNNNTRYLVIEIGEKHVHDRKNLLKDIEKFTDYLSVTKTEKLENGDFAYHTDIQVSYRKIEELEDFLIGEARIERYSM